MTAAPKYDYWIEISREDETEPLERVPVSPDWGPAWEWAALEALRQVPGQSVLRSADVRIEPVWDSERREPYVAGLRAIVVQDSRLGRNQTILPQNASRKATNRELVVQDDSSRVATVVPILYFQGLAKACSARLVETGKLQAGEVFRYRVCAYPSQQDVSETLSAGTLVSEPLILGDKPLDLFRHASTRRGSALDGELPVFLPRYVLDEMLELMQQADDVETGGILIGHLHRDPREHELFLEITAQIHACEAQQELARLTFTAETWAAVDAAISLRDANELYLGWWHTHPAGHWCDACPAERRQQCSMAGKLSGNFFSAHDLLLHRTVFPRAYSVAFVLTQNDCETSKAPLLQLYGWYHGLLVARGFQILESVDLVPSALALAGKGENDER